MQEQAGNLVEAVSVFRLDTDGRTPLHPSNLEPSLQD
jgi:hypothetical protein